MKPVAIIAISLWLLPAGVGYVAGCSSEPVIDGKPVTEWITLLRDEDWTTQAKASDTLARLGPSAVPFLKRTIRAKDPTLRRGVMVTLRKIGPPAKEVIPLLLRRMAVEEVAVIRAEILRVLAAIDPKAPGVAEEFKKRLRDQSPEVRDAASLGLQMLAPPRPTREEKGASADRPLGEESFVLRKAVADEMGKRGIAFGMVAEVVRESRRAAVIWPAFREGKILDDDVQALVFERQKGGAWVLTVGDIGLSKGDGPAKLAEVLGGADKQRVVRPCGVARAKLPGYLQQRGRAFQQALSAGKEQEAVVAYEELAQAFSFRMAAFSDMLPEMLTKGVFASAWKFEPASGDSCPVEIQLEGKVQTGQLELRPCGDGWVIAELKR